MRLVHGARCAVRVAYSLFTAHPLLAQFLVMTFGAHFFFPSSCPSGVVVMVTAAVPRMNAGLILGGVAPLSLSCCTDVVVRWVIASQLVSSSRSIDDCYQPRRSSVSTLPGDTSTDSRLQ